jgi:hypothetical protein
LPLFLQKESGFQGEALRNSTKEKSIGTLFTDERFQKVAGGRDGTPKTGHSTG